MAVIEVKCRSTGEGSGTGRENAADLSRKWKAGVLAFSLTIEDMRGQNDPMSDRPQQPFTPRATPTTPTSEMRPPRLRRGTTCHSPRQLWAGWATPRQHPFLGPQERGELSRAPPYHPDLVFALSTLVPPPIPALPHCFSGRTEQCAPLCTLIPAQCPHPSLRLTIRHLSSAFFNPGRGSHPGSPHG